MEGHKVKTTQEETTIDRWTLHPDDIAARYATIYCQRNSYQLGSETYFEFFHEVQQRIQTCIASGKLKLRKWPGRFVLNASSPITNNTLIDLQEFCDTAEDLGLDCPKNACELAETFRLPSKLPAPVSALAAPSISTDITQKSPLPDSARSALGSGKLWTPARLAELETYRQQHTTKLAAAHFNISPQRVRQLLPRKKPIQLGNSVFNQSTK